MSVHCPQSSRHWFTLRGWVGVRRPDCDRCGAPNPHPLSEEEQADYDGLLDHLRASREERR